MIALIIHTVVTGLYYIVSLLITEKSWCICNTDIYYRCFIIPLTLHITLYLCNRNYCIIVGSTLNELNDYQIAIEKSLYRTKLMVMRPLEVIQTV